MEGPKKYDTPLTFCAFYAAAELYSASLTHMENGTYGPLEDEVLLKTANSLNETM